MEKAIRPAGSEVAWAVVEAVGSAATRLVVLRGNSASGKSSVAAAIRQRYGRGLAIVGQDNIRRHILKERDTAGGVNIGLIDTMARYCLDRGYHVVIEGILHAQRYAGMLTQLCRDHRGRTHHTPTANRRRIFDHVPGDLTVRVRSGTPQLVGGLGAWAGRRASRVSHWPEGDENRRARVARTRWRG